MLAPVGFFGFISILSSFSLAKLVFFCIIFRFNGKAVCFRGEEAMRVLFDEISPQGNRYKISEVDNLVGHPDFAVKGPLIAQCALHRKGAAKVALTGRLQVVLSLVCHRCLELYDVETDSEFQVSFELESDESWRIKDLEARIADLDCEALVEPVIDLDDVVRQQVYLALPVKHLCSKTCKGICSQCGANLNLADCGCATDGKVSPFAALARLKK